MAKATIKLETKILDKLIKTVGAGRTKNYIIHDGVEYGIYVEFGTTNQQAKPALVPAFEEQTKLLPKAMGQAIERGVNPDDVLAVTAFNIQAGWQTNVVRNKSVDTGAYLNSIKVKVE